MEHISTKFRNIHDLNSRKFLQTFYSANVNTALANNSLTFPMEKLYQAVKQGHIKGGSLIDISGGTFEHLLNVICEIFQDIRVPKFNAGDITELTKWLYARTGAFDWSHMVSILTNMSGQSQPGDVEELQLKPAIMCVSKCDLDKDNMADPVVVSPADRVLLDETAEMISRNEEEEFVGNIKKDHLFRETQRIADIFWSSRCNILSSWRRKPPPHQ